MAIDSVFDILSDPTASTQITVKFLSAAPPQPCLQSDVTNLEMSFDAVALVLDTSNPPQVAAGQAAVVNGSISWTVPDSAEVPVDIVGLSFHWDIEGTYVFSFTTFEPSYILNNPGDQITIPVTLADIITEDDDEEENA